MSFYFNTEVTDKAEKNANLDKEIADLARFITPDPELDGKDILGFQMEREQGSIDELTKMVEDKTYIDPKLSIEENNKLKNDLLQDIEEHKKSLLQFANKKISLSKDIERLEVLKASTDSVCEITITNKSDRDKIKKIMQSIEKRLEETDSHEEKSLLTNMLGKLDSVKTAIDTNMKYNDVKIYLLDSELKYLRNIDKKTDTPITKCMLKHIASTLEQEQNRLKKNKSPLQEKFTLPLQVINQHLKDLESGTVEASNKQVMKKSIDVVSNLYFEIKHEKDVSPSFKDRFRVAFDRFRNFLKESLGIRVPEVASLKSKTLTNAFEIQKQSARLDKITENMPAPPVDNPRPPVQRL